MGPLKCILFFGGNSSPVDSGALQLVSRGSPLRLGCGHPAAIGLKSKWEVGTPPGSNFWRSLCMAGARRGGLSCRPWFCTGLVGSTLTSAPRVAQHPTRRSLTDNTTDQSKNPKPGVLVEIHLEYSAKNPSTHRSKWMCVHTYIYI